MNPGVRRWARSLPGKEALALVLALGPGAAVCAAPALEVAPARTELCSGRERLVRVDARGFSAGASQLRIGTETDSGVQVAFAAPPGASAAGSVAGPHWLLRLSPAGATVDGGVLHVFVRGPGQANGAEEFAAASVEIKAGEAGIAQLARLELHSAWETLNERQTAGILAVVTNLSGVPFDVAGLGVLDSGRPFVATAASGAAAGVRILPGQIYARRFDVTVAEGDRPPIGKHRLVFQLDGSAVVDGCKRSGSLTAGRDLAFAVIGESAVLTALAVPSFLLLPGLLFLLGAAIVRIFNWKAPDDTVASGMLEPKKTEFWAVGVTLSILGFLLISRFVRQDFFVAYRFEDIAWVWFLALLAGASSYFVVVLLLRVQAEREARRRAAALAATTFDTLDAPVTVLQKMGRKGLPLTLQAVILSLRIARIQNDDETQTAYVLEEDGKSAWVVPQIVVTIAENAEDPRRAAVNAANDRNDPAALAAAIMAAAGAGVAADWTRGKFGGARSVPVAAIKARLATQSIVEVQEQ